MGNVLKKKENYTFNLIYNNQLYEIIIQRDPFTIKTKDYFLFNSNISKKAGIILKTPNEKFEFIINIFIKNKVFIKNIIEDDSMILLFEPNNNKKFEIKLLSNKRDIRNFEPMTIIYDSYQDLAIDNTYSVFKSKNNIIYLIYSTKNKSIISYNLIIFKKLNEIKNAHSEYITNFRHMYDEQNKRDLLLSISANDNNLKVWNIYNFEILLNLKNVNNYGKLYSACFLNNNNQIFIITMTYEDSMINENKPIKIFDLKGKKLDEICESKEGVFIDSFNDNKNKKNYIITGNERCSKSYDFNNKKLYYIYAEGKCSLFKCYHYKVIINDEGEITKLIDYCYYDCLRIFNFNSGELLQKYNISCDIYGFCLLNNNLIILLTRYWICYYLYEENKMRFSRIESYRNAVSIQKFIHPNRGECFLFQNNENIYIY